MSSWLVNWLVTKLFRCLGRCVVVVHDVCMYVSGVFVMYVSLVMDEFEVRVSCACRNIRLYIRINIIQTRILLIVANMDGK